MKSSCYTLRMYIPLLGIALVTNAFAADAPAKLEFNRDVRPILSENCFLCHGPDKNNRKAKLRLDVRELATIYSRGLSPLEMGRTGTLAATDHALEIAALIFSGPSPWMADRF